jgi:hypothetical protein
MRKPKIFIPAGITDISRGSRSDSDDHPRFRVPTDPHPGGCARTVGIITDVRSLYDPLPRSNSYATQTPGGRLPHGGILDPGANFSDPSGIKKHAVMIESLKAFRFSELIDLNRKMLTTDFTD